MRVIIEESAIADIDGLAAWVAKDSPQGARSVVEKILQTIERLNVFPEMGTNALMKERTSAVCRARPTSSCMRFGRCQAPYSSSLSCMVRVIDASRHLAHSAGSGRRKGRQLSDHFCPGEER